MSSGTWRVVVPVKRLAVAKTRLELPPPLRRRVARAMAMDTVAAARGCPVVRRIVVVTDEPAEPFRDLGADVVPDAPDAGLNAALEHGAADAPGGVAALAADLPALRPDELTRALGAVRPGRRVVVPDVTGSGTTLLAAAPGVALRPEFGVSSYARHVRSGADELPAPQLPGLRQDVDTLADLFAAARLGVGVATARELPAVRAARSAALSGRAR